MLLLLLIVLFNFLSSSSLLNSINWRHHINIIYFRISLYFSDYGFDPGSTYNIILFLYTLHVIYRERTRIVRFSINDSYSSWGFTSYRFNFYRPCVVQVADLELSIDKLYSLRYSRFFYVILGMAWLLASHACVNCYPKHISFHIPDQSVFQFEGIKEASLHLISVILAFYFFNWWRGV